MTIEDKLRLLAEYKKSTGKEIDTLPIDLDSVKESGVNENDKKLLRKKVDKPIRSFTPIFESYDDEDDDDVFTPISFTHMVKEEEVGKVDLYETIKQMIFDIDCTNGYDNALTQFDNVLINLSDYNSGALTTSQILILVSTMIVKLEELSKIDYPETSLKEVCLKIEKDSNTFIHNGGIDKHFFASFFKYYVEIETRNFSKMKGKYKDNIADLKAHINKKGEMLQMLLKWLIM